MFIQEYFRDISPSVIPHEVISATIEDILRVAEKELQKKANKLKVLDVGSGWGEYSFELEKHVKEVVGLEPFKKVYDVAIKSKVNRKSKVKFHNLKIEDFHTQETFDLVLSLTTIEHMSNAERSFQHIFSLLKPGGMIYVTAPNKWWIFDSHYDGLPFLGWLPLPIANAYMRITGKGSSFKDCSYAKSYFGMKKLFNQFPCRYYFLLPNKDAAYLGCGRKGAINLFTRSFGIWLIQKMPLFWSISKGFILVVVKTDLK